MKSLSCLLRSVKALQSFHYSPCGGGQFSSTALRDVLVRHARDTLQVLKILGKGFDDFINPLQGFKVLKTAHLTCGAVIKDTKMARLVDMFPPSIQTILLNGMISEVMELDLFHSFIRLKESHLPNLTSVTLKDGSRARNDMILCRDQFSFAYMRIRRNLLRVSCIDLEGKWIFIGQRKDGCLLGDKYSLPKHLPFSEEWKSSWNQSTRNLDSNVAVIEHDGAVFPGVLVRCSCGEMSMKTA